MSYSGRFLVRVAPQHRSFSKSVIFFLSLLSVSFVTAAYLRGNFNNLSLSFVKKETGSETLIRKNKQIYSLQDLPLQQIPDLFILGVYESGDSLFFHQFKEVAEKFVNHQDLGMFLANKNVKDERAILDILLSNEMIKDFNLESTPKVFFFYKGNELVKWRLNLEYTNSIVGDLQKRVEGLINYKLQVLKP